MPPRFRVSAGSSYASLSELKVNVDPKDPSAPPYFEIKTESFEGRIVGNIKGFVNERGDMVSSKYFDRKDRGDTTWSIQVQGRFLDPVTANNVLFGNTFDRPLNLPWGTSAAMQFASLIDPVLSHDLNSEQPWALSPLISTMPHFKATRHSAGSPLPDFDPFSAFQEDISALFGEANGPLTPLQSASQRRKWFTKEERRKEVTYTREHVIQVDFAYGYFQFPELTLAIPGGISFDLKKYWSHQPVRFVCCERGAGGTGPGKVYFVVQFDVPELEDDEADGEGENEEADLPKKWATNGGGALADDID